MRQYLARSSISRGGAAALGKQAAQQRLFGGASAGQAGSLGASGAGSLGKRGMLAGRLAGQAGQARWAGSLGKRDSAAGRAAAAASLLTQPAPLPRRAKQILLRAKY